MASAPPASGSGPQSSSPAVPSKSRWRAGAILRSLCFSNDPSSSSTAAPPSSLAKSPTPQEKEPSTAATDSMPSESATRTQEDVEQAEKQCKNAESTSKSEQSTLFARGHPMPEELANIERVSWGEGDATALAANDIVPEPLRLKRNGNIADDIPLRSSVGMFKASSSTDLLFLMDITGSMSQYIEAAKEQIKKIVDNVKRVFFNEADVRIAVVGYRDHADAEVIEFLDFTGSVEDVHSFLSKLEARGGDDLPENVLGGIEQALAASWKNQNRCIMHIADSPPHGNLFRSKSYSTYLDNYPIEGSEPHRLKYKPLIRQMTELQINYALLRMNHSTDLMAAHFSAVYAASCADCRLYKYNAYKEQAFDRRTVLGKQTLRAADSSRFRDMSSATAETKIGGDPGALLFVEEELGTTYSALHQLVVKSVTSSAARTATRMSSKTRTQNKSGLELKLGSLLHSVEEDEDGELSVTLDTTRPEWDSREWFDETLTLQGFSPDVTHGASTLDAMMECDDNIKMSTVKLTVQKRLKPFAQGILRTASYAQTVASTDRFVVKSFKRRGKELEHLAEGIRCQALCKAFALEFNALVNERYSLDFIVATCLKGKVGTAEGEECMSLEPFISGTYVKYNNNCSWVNDEDPHDPTSQAAQAFSHFTFERSQGKFLVSDLQGVGRVLTDPAIHARDPSRFELSDTNLGEEGFKFFFATHVCNHVCRKLNLRSNAEMFMSGNFMFRYAWPSASATVFCANKLCGKIVYLRRGRWNLMQSGKHWCITCFPQLNTTLEKRRCTEEGPEHEFSASLFYYESQGLDVPGKCPEHRENIDDMREPATLAAMNRRFWSKLKFARRRRSAQEGTGNSSTNS